MMNEHETQEKPDDSLDSVDVSEDSVQEELSEVDQLQVEKDQCGRKLMWTKIKKRGPLQRRGPVQYFLQNVYY